MRRHWSLPLFCCLMLLLSPLAILFAPPAQAQGRVSDKDLEVMMRNLRDDSKNFRPVFDKAIEKSTIRKTSQAKDAQRMVAAFAKQTETLMNHFRKTRKGGSELSMALETAGQIDPIVNGSQMNAKTIAAWQKILTELGQVTDALGVTRPDFLQTAQEGASSGGEESCLQSAGASRANTLVRQCLDVSPATHPPCNAENSCSMIVSEIKRGCAYIGNGAPGFCKQYQ